MKKWLSTIALTFLILFGGSVAATAGGCYYAPPTTGDHVTYYNCRGPYVYNAYSSNRGWECYADYDSWAEWFMGKHDGYAIVFSGMTCYA